MRGWPAVLLWIAAVPAAVPQDPADAAWQLTLRLSQVRRQAAQALAGQPDYTCRATFDRFRHPVKEREERRLDTVRVEVAYVGGQELYSWPGEEKFSDSKLSSMVGVGLMGDGDFAVHAHNVFVANTAIEKYAGEEMESGRWGTTSRKLWRWDYRISQYSSGWVVQFGGAQQTVGSEGSFWADAETHDLVRMETRATDLMVGFPAKSISSSVEYGRVRIGEQDVLMPLRAELKTVSIEGSESRNLVEYSNCRQYAGHSTIRFGDPAEITAGAKETAPAAQEEGRLPGGLTVQIRLAERLDTGAVTVGDLVAGALAAPLRQGGREIAPKGALVRGRVRLLTRDSTSAGLHGQPESFTELGLAFNELEVAGRIYHFAAKLKSFDTGVPGVHMTMVREREVQGARMRDSLAPTAVPGVAVFFLDGRSGVLAKGTLMTWITEE